MTNDGPLHVARLLRFARNDGGYVVVKRQMLSLRGARSATKQSLRPGWPSHFGETNPRSHFGETNPSAASTRRAACSHLILRSRAQRGVSKDGDAFRCSPPFETPAAGGLLRVRSKGNATFWRNEPENSFWPNEPETYGRLPGPSVSNYDAYQWIAGREFGIPRK